MVVAMMVGMMVLDPLWSWVASATEWSGTFDRSDVHAMVMAADMVIAMSLWMWFRGHTKAPIVEMGVAMFAPFVVLLVPYWAGVLSGSGLLILGHILMLGTMLLAMLWRRDEYQHHHHRNRWPRRAATVPESSGTPNVPSAVE